MKIFLLGATLFMAAGFAYSGSNIHADASSDMTVSGKVTAIHGDDIIALEGHSGFIVLADPAGAILDNDADADAEYRQQMLSQMIGSGPVTCHHQSYDEYGRMVAKCMNKDGQALTAQAPITGQAAKGSIAGL